MLILANAITSENQYEEFQSLRNGAYGLQGLSIALGGASAVLLGTTLYFGGSTDKEELLLLESTIDELKKEPIEI